MKDRNPCVIVGRCVADCVCEWLALFGGVEPV